MAIWSYVFFIIEDVWQPFTLHPLPEIHPDLPGGLPGRVFPDRVFIHRINSLERVRYAADRYTGMEIDVMFDEERLCFDVHHPSSSTIGLTLETLIDKLKNPRKHFFWLDFKNLTNTNQRAAVKELLRIAVTFNITQNIIVESSNAAMLGAFAEKGFYTSYYLPVIDPVFATTKEMEIHVKNIASTLKKSKVHAISANQRQYRWIKKYFTGYDLCFWNFSADPLASALVEYKLMKDKNAKILMVDDKSPGDR